MMKCLLDRGLLHGDCLTPTGETIAESLANVEPYAEFPSGQDIITPGINLSRHPPTCVFCVAI